MNDVITLYDCIMAFILCCCFFPGLIGSLFLFWKFDVKNGEKREELQNQKFIENLCNALEDRFYKK